MKKWLRNFKYDPIAPLLECDNEAIVALARCDLLDEKIKVEALWESPEAQKIIGKQRTDGSWKYPGKPNGPEVIYTMLETWRQLGYLVEKFGFTKKHPAVANAAKYFFDRQSK